MRNYGEKPKYIGVFDLHCPEMMFYQDYPIKLADRWEVYSEERIKYFNELIEAALQDFINEYGVEEYKKRNVYISCKKLYQSPDGTFNRLGYHADGFMSDDVGYIWSDIEPTIFNNTRFCLSQDDKKSLEQMADQAIPANDFDYGNNSLVRMDQFNIHRVSNPTETQLRTFFKITFSRDKYNLEGNSINPLLDYNWTYRSRNGTRNVPQTTGESE